jgi:hypothetical protein
MPPDYQQGKIYKLFSPSKGLVYYGSTTESLSSRLAKHAYCFRNPEKFNKRTASIVLECDDYKIELVKDFPCNNNRQLLTEEGIYIRNNECINKQIPNRTKKDYMTTYSLENKERIQEYRKKYKEAKKRGETAPHAE